mmetsp:Transcript_13523/g.36495  ORF Transcript_13523/g.36495 Transcript_13523/m.36495 type:complete len:521 (-) Transcript_13523:67-1629(-)
MRTVKVQGGDDEGHGFQVTGVLATPANLHPRDLGLGEYAGQVDSVPKISNGLRKNVRDKTARLVLSQLGCLEGIYGDFSELAVDALQRTRDDKESLPEAVKLQLGKTRLFIDADPNERVDDWALLRRFECLAVPVRADYDADFRRIRTKPVLDRHASKVSKASRASEDDAALDCDGPGGFSGWIWVMHMAAPNIGENAQAEDFVEYSVEQQGRHLDEDAYITDMGRIWRNALVSMASLGVEDAIFFPLGMGAFLRNLSKCDRKYFDEERMTQLRRKVADQLMTAIGELSFSHATGKSPGAAGRARGPKRVHLCLMLGTGEEGVQNHNCFLQAAAASLQEWPLFMEVLKLHLNVDSLQFAHNLATQHGAEKVLKVGVLNGANKKLIGNHWFQDGARFAIDENLHRRSASMARTSLLLNFDVEPRPRHAEQLIQNLAWLGGRVLRIGEVVDVPSKMVPAENGHIETAWNGNADVAAKPSKPQGQGGAGRSGGCCRRRAGRSKAGVSPEPLSDVEAAVKTAAP